MNLNLTESPIILTYRSIMIEIIKYMKEKQITIIELDTNFKVYYFPKTRRIKIYYKSTNIFILMNYYMNNLYAIQLSVTGPKSCLEAYKRLYEAFKMIYEVIKKN
jgi:hypothetical protein